ncbi:hypothetical protein [Teredinibacter sp. KSP-S5-2]|uniref:hypothetical protein n=1 Tax=Teredinibacter sp. KSP-S5-2 TaxID=3034506 RepID=UPI002934F1EB|nr:hypothetical protein [Teredinibacter sp. KSP-S5-2]WNO10306.1 hypothetical protein P5V12_03880 [Teredinibacter sp. KSP-S5-2]
MTYLKIICLSVFIVLVSCSDKEGEIETFYRLFSVDNYRQLIEIDGVLKGNKESIRIRFSGEEIIFSTKMGDVPKSIAPSDIARVKELLPKNGNMRYLSTEKLFSFGVNRSSKCGGMNCMIDVVRYKSNVVDAECGQIDPGSNYICMKPLYKDMYLRYHYLTF